ncbi:MAG: hypothetical protein AB1705_11595 [Verrucomicrobiota bacterium]
MNCALQILGKLVLSLFIGVVAMSIEPYPGSHDLAMLLTASIAFAFLCFLPRSPDTRRAIVTCGLITIACFAVAQFWFEVGVMGGWPVFPVIQQFFFVDGESAYDADAANLFLTLLFCVAMVMGLWRIWLSALRFRRKLPSVAKCLKF